MRTLQSMTADNALEGVSGVYCISNKVTGRKYIGSSESLRTRLLGHYRRLAWGKHKIADMQSDCNNHGVDSFCAEILYSENEYSYYNNLIGLEYMHIANINPEYNTNINKLKYPSKKGCLTVNALAALNHPNGRWMVCRILKKSESNVRSLIVQNHPVLTHSKIIELLRFEIGIPVNKILQQ